MVVKVREYWIIAIATVIVLSACANDFTNPSFNIQLSNFEGIWIANYASGVRDTLLLRSDGAFKQVFEDSKKDYIYDSDWNEWTLEHAASGLVRLHLQGGRYFVEGISIAESNGRKNPENPCLGDDCTWGLEPRLFYDPFAEETILMVDELLLISLVDTNENLILHHVWTGSDRGFAIIGGDKEIFYKQQIESSSKAHIPYTH